jgi:two-component system NtrC family sensor kinase
MEPDLTPPTTARHARAMPWQWPRFRSIRHKLLAMALGPLLVVFPLLVAALVIWGNVAYDRLLVTKVRSDLSVAQGYFDKVLDDVGQGTQGMAMSYALVSTLSKDMPEVASPTATGTAPTTPGELHVALADLLERHRHRQGLDFMRLYSLDGQALDRPVDTAEANLPLPPRLAARMRGPDAPARGELAVLSAAHLHQLAPELEGRTGIALVHTPNAAPTHRTREDRAMVAASVAMVRNPTGQPMAMLVGGVLMNQNLGFIDHINRVVYPEGSLPFGSQGTATLFLDDVRITTNVRLFQSERAIGTRVSQAVRDAVLSRGETWLDRAFVVNDWYVSAYQPLLDGDEQRIGMLYVGYLEQPFRWVRYAMLGIIGLIFLMVMAVASVLSLRWARGIFRPVERMNDTMQRVRNGDTGARVGTTATHDELGKLAQHLDQLLDVIADKTRSLEQWGSALDHRVNERTRELAATNDALRQTQQQLVRSEKLAVMGQLAASVAHEVNNPIAVMQGNLDLLRETLGPAATNSQVELKLLDEQIERIRMIVQQLLQHARPGEYAGYVDTVDVNEAVKACLLLVNHKLSQQQITVVLDLRATGQPGINRHELEQVLINLLMNAANAMPGGGELTIRTLDLPSPPGEGDSTGVAIEVQDAGMGLTDDVKDKLFQPFFTTRPDGHGLGLWISLGLLERYGGGISANNRLDAQGAVFTVTLRTDALMPNGESR